MDSLSIHRIKEDKNWERAIWKMNTFFTTAKGIFYIAATAIKEFHLSEFHWKISVTRESPLAETFVLSQT